MAEAFSDMDRRLQGRFPGCMTTTQLSSESPTSTGGGNAALRTGTLLLATLTTGLSAGGFVDWANTIMPGLGDVDDRTFVTAYQALDAAITNPLFLGVEFMGALVLTGFAAVLHRRPEPRQVLLWVGAGLACVLVVHGITYGVNEPLNEKLRTAGDLQSNADYAAAPALLDDARGTAWNGVRAVAATAAFGCVAWALTIHGRVARRGRVS